MTGWGIPLARVDGTREKELADQYQIGGWPQFKLFRKGRVYDYKGPREKDNIIEFMRKEAQEPSEEKKHFLGISNNLDRKEITGTIFENIFLSQSDFYPNDLMFKSDL